MSTVIYGDLTPQEKATARVIFLSALNDMEAEQARDAGKRPQPYKMNSPLFKTMLPESEWERYIDENGSKRIRRAF